MSCISNLFRNFALLIGFVPIDHEQWVGQS